MADTPPKQKFQVYDGKDASRYARLQADLTFADPKVTYTMVTESMFSTLLDDAVREQREQEVANTLEFPSFDHDVLDAIGNNVIRQVLAKLTQSTAWHDEDEDNAHAHLEAFLEKYIQNH